MIPGDVEMQGEEFEVGANDENSNLQRVQDHPSDENPHVEQQSPQSSEPRLPHPRRRITSQQFERNVRARQSTSSFHPVLSSEAALAFSADSLEPACLSTKQWKKVGVEVSHPMTADMFEKPEDDWLATASSRARARVEVNIKKLSAEERAQFRAAQHKEMDQWISNDVISVCRRAGIPKERVMTMRWVHTWKVDENTGEAKAKARLVVKGFTDPDLTEIRSESPTPSRLSTQLILQLSASRGFRLSDGDVKTAFLSGDREEARRDVYAEPPQEMRDKLQITREQVLKLETAVYGLRNAPRAWWKRVVRDLTETGWVQHQLGQSVYLHVHEWY